MEGEGVSYRKTLAIRVSSDSKMPAPSRFRVYTDSVCKPLRVRIQFGRREKARRKRSPVVWRSSTAR